jgi:hypothetical protein
MKTTKTFHHRGTESTEKNFLLLTSPSALLTKQNSVLSVPLWLLAFFNVETIGHRSGQKMLRFIFSSGYVHGWTGR